jgi:hypothetical protein
MSLPELCLKEADRCARVKERGDAPEKAGHWRTGSGTALMMTIACASG